MEQYIPKSALLAEIERLKDELKASDTAAYIEAYIIGAEHTIKTISDVIDTLEVKSVDLNEEVKKYLFNCIDNDGLKPINIAKHFFELGLKAQIMTSKLKQRIGVLKMSFWTGL